MGRTMWYAHFPPSAFKPTDNASSAAAALVDPLSVRIQSPSVKAAGPPLEGTVCSGQVQGGEHQGRQNG